MQTNEGRRKIRMQILSYSFSVVLQNYCAEMQGGKRLTVLPNGVTFNLCVYACDYMFFLPFWLPLEHGASMKLPVSLQFLNLGQSVGLLGRVISSSQGLYLHRTTQT
jgi:hypothetical protein